MVTVIDPEQQCDNPSVSGLKPQPEEFFLGTYFRLDDGVISRDERVDVFRTAVGNQITLRFSADFKGGWANLKLPATFESAGGAEGLLKVENEESFDIGGDVVGNKRRLECRSLTARPEPWEAEEEPDEDPDRY